MLKALTRTKKGDALVLRQFFGLLEGEDLAKFLEEVEALTPDQKEALVDGIRDESYNYD